MNLSMKWLGDHIKLDVPVKRFADDMTMSGSKVEGFEIEGHELENIVVGRVLSVERHPNADTLFICKIDAGGEAPLQIVTGAANVTEGSFVPVALNNSVVFGGKKIKKSKLRGEESDGMLCSLEELGLTKHDFPYAVEDGIFLLGDDCERVPGTDIHKAIGLDDTIVEFEITSNRPDCLSVIGLAREVAATYGMDFKAASSSVKAGGGGIEDILSVTVENPGLCLRYAAAAVKNVRIGPSPRWMRERLRASGVRSINNIVDITNYVMLETGQPMHAFDLKHVAGSKIIVRNAKPGETIMTLDGVTRTLSPEMLVIADEKSPSAVAGVMGGEFSGVYDDTRTVIFESACFDGMSVRLTSKKLGLRTESSSRFEKGLDPENCMPALLRACELVEELGAGDVADGFLDVRGDIKPQTVLELDPDWVSAFIGAEISEEDMAQYLRLLGFGVEGRRIFVPSFRGDVECVADLAEEIARLYGYDKIPSTALRGLSQGRLSLSQKFERLVERVLTASGYSEVITYSFVSPKYYDKIRMAPDDSRRDSVVISNPLGEDTSVMRTTAIPSMLEVLSRNYNNRNAAVRFYELATEYIPQKGEKLPRERKRVILGAYGDNADFFEMKGVVELLLDRAGVRDWDVAPDTGDSAFHPGRCARITVKGEPLGILGELHPETAANYGIEARAYLADLDMETLLGYSNTERKYKPLPKFPASTRDLALVCEEALPVLAMQKLIASMIGPLLEKLELFDIYRGKQVGEGKKSAAFSLTLRADDRTLTDEECDGAISRVLEALKQIGVELRS